MAAREPQFWRNEMSRLLLLRIGTTTLCILMVFPFVRGQSAGTGTDPRIGTWKLNIEKSKYTPGSGPQAPNMLMRQLTSRADGFVVFTQTGLDSQNNPVFIQSTYKFDGKGYPEFTQSTLAELSAVGTRPNSNIYKLVDAYTVEITRTDQTGKVTGISTQVLSRDGRTHISTGRDATGKVLATQVWDKQ